MVAVDCLFVVRLILNCTCCGVKTCVLSVEVKVLRSRATLHLVVAVGFVNRIIVVGLCNKLKVLRIFFLKVRVAVTVNHITADGHKVNASLCSNLKSVCKVNLT